MKTWNPIKLFRSFRKLSKRLKQKNISGNMKGDGIVQGGIIIFDKNGKARYAYREGKYSAVHVLVFFVFVYTYWPYSNAIRLAMIFCNTYYC